MKLEPTKRELDARGRAAANVEPYDKRVVSFQRTCPFCDGKIRGINGYHCNCGRWSIDWLTGRWNFVPAPGSIMAAAQQEALS